MVTFVADLQTTNDPQNCRVWGWGAVNVWDLDDLFVGNDIFSFMDWCEQRRDNITVYIHELKYGIQFLISYLFAEGFTHVSQPKERATKTFTTMISDKGLYYGLEVIFFRKGKNIKKVTFLDSHKLLPMPVEKIADSFKTEYEDIEIDENNRSQIPPETPLTELEMQYLSRDIRIVAVALRYFLDNGMDKITIGSCAIAEYKKLIGERKFRIWFPTIKTANDDIRKAYKGGFAYVNPDIAGKTVGAGMVLDINSMYPACMKFDPMPYATPIFFKGKYQPDPLYPLYVQQLRCAFKLKPGKLPTVQVKYGTHYYGTEYLTSSDDEEMVLTLTSVDLELFYEHYDVVNEEWIKGWKFQSSTGLFTDYVDKWTGIKIQSKLEKNYGMYILSKTMQNALYGKFGTKGERRSKIPYMKNGMVHYEDAEPVEVPGAYVAVAAFITAYGRRRVITAAQRITDDYNSGKSDIQWLYADTDSCHILSPNGELPEGLEISATELGAWKVESQFYRAKYLRTKCYVDDEIITEEEYNKGKASKFSSQYSEKNGNYHYLKITAAGMPDTCYEQVTFNNFQFGKTYGGKKIPQVVPGGIVFVDDTFTIVR